LESTKLIVKGVYSYIRHPLYTGASLFLLGSLLTMVAHLTWCVSLVVVAASVFVMCSLAITARRETRILAATFGAEFLSYKKRVHAFLPLHKYEGKEENE
jgi:protein-S-isoprenylcysteine O-methyltransferase Ste14